MNNPLVSVCIPTFNGAEYIESCIRSCLAQTYRDLEIIVCDDCSSDSTLEVVNKIVSADKRIKVFKNETNLGLVGNWNATLGHASGEYVKWLFQDDTMEYNAIELFVEAAKLNHCFVVSKRDFVVDGKVSQSEKEYYGSKVKKLEDHFSDSAIGHYFSVQDISVFTTNYIALNFIAEPSLIFFKRSLIRETGLYDDKLHQICDLEFNLRLAALSGVYVINLPLCHFSIHPNSTTHSNLKKKYFQLRFIEQAYYARKVLKDPVFATLRKYFSFFQKTKLDFYWRYRIHEAMRYIARQTNTDEYKEALAKHPELKQSGLAEGITAPLFFITDLLKSRR